MVLLYLISLELNSISDIEKEISLDKIKLLNC